MCHAVNILQHISTIMYPHMCPIVHSTYNNTIAHKYETYSTFYCLEHSVYVQMCPAVNILQRNVYVQMCPVANILRHQCTMMYLYMCPTVHSKIRNVYEFNINMSIYMYY